MPARSLSQERCRASGAGCELDDRQLAAIVRHMQDLPGEVLFQYVGESGERRPIESADVNAYLQQAAAEDFTSKDFRTWAGTVLAARALAETGNLKQAIERVAKELGNTQAVCRKCYVHPAIFDSHAQGTLLEALARSPQRARRHRPLSLDADETAVRGLLHAWSRRERALARRSGANGSLVSLLALTARHLRKRGTTQPAARGATR